MQELSISSPSATTFSAIMSKPPNLCKPQFSPLPWRQSGHLSPKWGAGEGFHDGRLQTHHHQALTQRTHHLPLLTQNSPADHLLLGGRGNA